MFETYHEKEKVRPFSDDGKIDRKRSRDRQRIKLIDGLSTRREMTATELSSAGISRAVWTVMVADGCDWQDTWKINKKSERRKERKTTRVHEHTSTYAGRHVNVRWRWTVVVVYIHAYISMCTYVRMQYTYIHKYVHTYTYTYIHIYITKAANL